MYRKGYQARTAHAAFINSTTIEFMSCLCQTPTSMTFQQTHRPRSLRFCHGGASLTDCVGSVTGTDSQSAQGT